MSKPLRNFDKFEEGHYYVYTGEKTDKWANAMEAVLERKIHKCLNVCNQETTYAEFKDVKGCFWDWKNGFDNWVEVENPDAVFEVGDDCLRYGKTHQYWKVAKVHERYFHNDKTKNGYNNEVGIHYICKRKHNKKEEPKENVLRGTPDIQTHSHNSQFFSTGTSIKMSLGDIQSDLNFHPIWLTTKALSEWMEFWTDKRKDVDKKDNVFKKYIRTKKYMKFVKEKK